VRGWMNGWTRRRMRRGGRGEGNETYLGLMNSNSRGIISEEGAVRVDHALSNQGVEIGGRGRGCTDGLADLREGAREGGLNGTSRKVREREGGEGGREDTYKVTLARKSPSYLLRWARR